MNPQHAEAFCLMQYECLDCGRVEIFWNSRDGVTPFYTNCPVCGGDMPHTDWGDDTYAPDHVPEPGQGIWIDLPESLRRPMAAARIQAFEGSEFEVPEAQRAEVIQELIDTEFAPGTPFLIRWPGRKGGSDEVDSD